MNATEITHNFTLEPGVWMAPAVLENKDGYPFQKTPIISFTPLTPIFLAKSGGIGVEEVVVLP